MAGLDLDAILDPVVSHAAASGWFERVNTVEPKSKPGLGLTCAVWVDAVGPAPGASGLAATSALLILNVRLYTSMLGEPQDAIDPNMTGALNALFAAYSADFDLGGQVRNIDLLGEFGPGLSAKAGYLDISGTLHRVYTITLPMVINDVWVQAP